MVHGVCSLKGIKGSEKKRGGGLGIRKKARSSCRPSLRGEALKEKEKKGGVKYSAVPAEGKVLGRY